MRIGIIADTHIPGRRSRLPGVVAETFAGVDLILHAGDINHLSVLRDLNTIAPTFAVAGNSDPPGLQEALGYQRVFDLAGYRIGLTHGHRGPGRTTPERAWRTFGGRMDVVVFGHSHQPLDQWRESCLLLNPGSPTDKRRERRYSLAILTLTEEINSGIVYFD